jgi:hypothetical protein
MASKNLCVELEARKDSYGNTYYIGKLQFKGNINFEDGISFMVFTSEGGAEQLQICSFEKSDKKNYRQD